MLNFRIAAAAALLLFLVSISNTCSQSSADITLKNIQKEQIRKSNIKSKTIWEYRYYNNGEESQSDSGYKAFYYGFDKQGRITEYTKYHIFSDLTVREMYRYGKTDNIEQEARYNAGGDMIEQIDFRYNSKGKLKKEIHTAFYNGIRPGVYFTINASIIDDSLFSRVQDDLEIDPKLESYTITVNISDNDEQNQYIVIGDESDPTSPRYSWSQLTMESQRGLLSFKGPARKEHTYINKNIANINYKYDKNGSITERTVFNTGNDQIGKETYTYNGDNRKISYYKYSENGKISSMETYTYDANGRLTETVGIDPGGKIASRLVFRYGQSSYPDEKIWMSASGEVNGSYKYVYDNSDNITEEIKIRGENEKESRQVYKYDENGNLLEIAKYDINDKKEKTLKYYYEFY